MQKVEYPTGGFALHAVRLDPFKSRFSAYYDAAGVMLDAEAFDSAGREREVSASQRSRLMGLGPVHATRAA